MKIIKTNLRDRISDEFLNDAVVTYFEDDLFERVSNEDMYHFQGIKACRGHCFTLSGELWVVVFKTLPISQ